MKTETKHTPGPWIVDDRHVHTASGLTYPIGQEPETDVIALIDTDQHANGLLNDTDKANLRLIAAAPELLEALADILSQHGGGALGNRLENNARAAITKATT